MPGHAHLVLTSQEHCTGFYWKHLGLPPEGFLGSLQCVVGASLDDEGWGQWTAAWPPCLWVGQLRGMPHMVSQMTAIGNHPQWSSFHPHHVLAFYMLPPHSSANLLDKQLAPNPCLSMYFVITQVK